MNRRTAFTLVELLISVAMVLILVLGVNLVFRTATNGIGAGQALSTATRDNRASQATFYGDLQYYTEASPLLVIESNLVDAFTSREAEQADRDGAPRSIDVDGNNVEGEAGVAGEQIPFAGAHRVDKLSMMIRGPIFRRTTGNDGTFADSATTSQEAFVSYGHLRLYDDTGDINLMVGGGTNGDGSYPFPGTVPTAGDPNPNNQYARNWILGRSQVLLLPAPPATQSYIEPGTTPMGPLAFNSMSTGPANSLPRAFAMNESRLDLAQTSFAAYAGTITGFAGNWWEFVSYRFVCNPYMADPAWLAAPPATRGPKLTSRLMAQAAPNFINGASHFIVEFAGDFCNQDATGAVTGWYGPGGGGTDGIVDYVTRLNGTAIERRVRWYGLPRDINGDGVIKGTGVDIIGGASTYQDVVPLRDILTANAAPGAPYATFERAATAPRVSPPAPKANYADVLNGMVPADKYYAAWGPGDTVRPKMIRITMAIEDPTGRLTEPQWSEYVIQLP